MTKTRNMELFFGSPVLLQLCTVVDSGRPYALLTAETLLLTTYSCTLAQSLTLSTS